MMVDEYQRELLTLKRQEVEILRINTLVNVLNVIQPSLSEKERAFWREFLRGKIVEVMGEKMAKQLGSMKI